MELFKFSIKYTFLLVECKKKRLNNKKGVQQIERLNKI